jgi:type VI secretion system secreted protein VgrG
LTVAQNAIRMFSYKGDVRLISAKEDIDIAAIQDTVAMFAKLDVTLRGNRVIFNATKSVTISGGGSYTRWSKAGIISGTLGKWTVHAKQRIKMVEPRSLPVVGPELPPFISTPSQLKTMALFFHYPDLNGVPHAPYRVVFANGEVRQGKLNAKGRATLEDVPVGRAQVYFGETAQTQAPEPVAWGPPPADSQVLQELQQSGLASAQDTPLDAVLARITERDHG